MLAWWRRRQERRRWAARAETAMRRLGFGMDGELVALIIGVTILEANATLGPLQIIRAPAEEARH